MFDIADAIAPGFFPILTTPIDAKFSADFFGGFFRISIPPKTFRTQNTLIL